MQASLTQAEKVARKPATTSRQQPQFVREKTPAQELAELREYGQYLRQHPEEAKAMLVKIGICLRNGKLTKAYGG
jgi:hypothetical protein